MQKQLLQQKGLNHSTAGGQAFDTRRNGYKFDLKAGNGKMNG